jgi:hypothetical protein
VRAGSARDRPVAPATSADRARRGERISPDARRSGPLLATTRSAADGRFTASFLRPGRYQVVAEDLERDVTSGTAVVEVTAGRSADVGDLRF